MNPVLESLAKDCVVDLQKWEGCGNQILPRKPRPIDHRSLRLLYQRVQRLELIEILQRLPIRGQDFMTIFAVDQTG